MHGAKESRKLAQTVRCSQSGRLPKQNCFKKNHGERKTLPHCTRCSQTSQPLWNEVSIAIRPEWLVNPRTSTRPLEQVNSIYWGEDLETPRSTEASSSSFFHPSCREEKNLNQTRTATSKRSCWRRQRRFLLAVNINLICITLHFVRLLLLNRLAQKPQLNMFWYCIYCLLCLLLNVNEGTA